MLNRVYKIIGVGKGEEKRFFFMGILLFLLFAGTVFGRSGRDAIFLKRAGYENLPYMYIINAFLMVFVSVVYSSIVDKLSRYKFFIGIFISSILVIILLRIILILNFPIIPYIVFTFTEVLLIVPIIHFWTFGNDVFNPREGKRIFPLIAGVGLLGTLTGGILTKIIAELFSTQDLFLSWIVIFIIAIPVSNRIYHSADKSYLKALTKSGRKTGGIKLYENIKGIWELPLVRRLAYLTLPMYIALYIIDYRFYLTLHDAISDQDKLAGFLGLFSTIRSMVAFVFLFFVTNKLLRRFGPGKMVLIHPLSVISGSIALLMKSFIFVPVNSILSMNAMLAVFAKFSHIGVKYSFAEPTNQLIYNSIPSDKRGRSRVFISGTVVPISIAISGLFLLISFKFLKLDIKIISYITIFLSILWFYISLKVKKEYLQAMVDNLASNNMNMRDDALSELGNIQLADNRNKLFESVLSENIDTAKYAVMLLSKINDPEVFDELAKILPETKPGVQTVILSILHKGKSGFVKSRVLEQLDSRDNSVIASAICCAGKFKERKFIGEIDYFLNHEDILVKSEAIIGVLRIEKRVSGIDAAVEILMEMARNPNVIEREKAAYIIREVGGEHLFDVLLELSKSEEENVQYEVIKALGESKNIKARELLFKYIENKIMIPYVVEAFIRLGDEALEYLHRKLIDGKFSSGFKQNILQCIGEIGSEKSINLLLNYFKKVSSVEKFLIIDALSKIKENLLERGILSDHELLDKYFHDRSIFKFFISIVDDIKYKIKLTDRLKGITENKSVLLVIDFIERSIEYKKKEAIESLKIIFNYKIIDTAAVNLKSGTKRVRAEALEVIGEVSWELTDFIEILEFDGEKDITPLTRDDINLLFRELIVEDEIDDWYHSSIIFAIGFLKLPGFEDYLDRFKESLNIFLSINRLLTLKKLDLNADEWNSYKLEIEDMNFNMDRILFLRSIPLFSDIEGNDLKWINEILTEEDYLPGDVIFKENDEGDALYIIRQGRVKIVKGEKSSIVLTILEERDYFGEMALLDRDPRSASVIVVDDAKILMIKRDHFQSLLISRPKIAFSLFKSFTQRMRDLQTQLMELQQGG